MAEAAISKDVQASFDQNAASKTVSSPAFTTKSGQELLLAFVTADQVTTPNTTAVSVTGGGLTWVLVVRTNSQAGTSEIWRAFSTGILTNATVTATLSQTVASSITVMSFAGVNVSGTNGSGAIGAVKSASASSGAPSASLVTTQNNSVIVGAGNDFDNPILRTAASGQTIIHQTLSSTGDTYWVQRATSQTALKGTTVSIADSAPTSDRYNLSICEIVPSSVAAPQLTLSGSALSYGSVTDGSSKALSLTVTSTGTSAVSVSSVSITGTGFSVGTAGFPKTLTPGQSLAIPITFAPLAAGAVTGKFTVVSNSSTSATSSVTLTGTGVAPNPQVSFSATTLSYGNVTNKTAKALSLTLTSTGNAAVTISSIAISGTGFTAVTTGFPKTLTPGQTLAIPVTFTPIAAGAVAGKLTVVSNSTTGATTAVTLTGTGVATAPKVSFSTTALSYGNVTSGTTKALSLTLTSSGSSTLTISSIIISGTGFSATTTGFPKTVAPGQTVVIPVTFAPLTTGAVTGSLTIRSNSTVGGIGTVALSGTGVLGTAKLAVSATTLSFGSVTVGSTKAGTVTLSSTGTSAVTITSASTAGAGFSVVGGSFPLSLSAGSTATLTIQFKPGTSGAATGSLTIASNSSLGSTSTVALTGTGAAATTHSVDLSWTAPVITNDPIEGYHVYRASGSSTSYVLLTPTISTPTSFLDSTVLSGTTYVYQVKSVDYQGMESVASNTFSVAIP